ncbi:MAG: tetratricopeptide repeat protein [Bacteroidota bacterium]
MALKPLINLSYFIVISFVVTLFSCRDNEHKSATVGTKNSPPLYLNHADSAKYVGINTCKLCHQDIYNTFIKTGMGKSFDVATKQKSSGNFESSIIHDNIGDFSYKAFWLHDSLQILEYRLQKKDTIYKRQETVNYIIGSGQHTNSHIQSINGYLNQMPMTYYVQKQKWDLPPGFENGHNSRFSRKIGLECMSCHNNYPEFVLGSENKFTKVPEGINCERCHGPGSIHVAERQTGKKIDTSKYIDYSIVNPSKLSIDEQFDICQRCHLQGNAILKEGKSFYDFKPGMKLSDYMTVFLPKYKNADDEFIMASHADRLKQSACFIKSLEHSKLNETKTLKPFKDAITCVTCHNPHVSVRETNANVFNDACNNCHKAETKNGPLTLKNQQMNASKLLCSKNGITKTSNCVSCHMPKSGSIDIPHVTIHDHYIRKPFTKKDKQALKQFIGLYAINEKNPNSYLKAKAYLNQYEKFEQKSFYLDSASIYLKTKNKEDLKNNIHLLVQLEFIKKNYKQIMMYVNALTDNYLIEQKLIHPSYVNEDAWTSYRIGESFYEMGINDKALLYFKKAVELAPFALDFKNKYASSLASNNFLKEAEIQYQEIINEYPKHVSALTNLGYIKLSKGDLYLSENLYLKALAIDPDYEALILNLAGLYAYKKDYQLSKTYLLRLLKKNPNNIQAQQALIKINSLI